MAGDGFWREAALAKVNLTLAIVGRRADGYHLLDSVVAFADVGEALNASRADAPRLEIVGPQAGGLGAAGNLVLKADAAFRARFCDAPILAYRLTKTIPVAAGLGGGSADAAAALRILARLVGVAATSAELAAIAASIGADVPVCLLSRAARMTGIGETVAPLAGGPKGAALLVNPGVGVLTHEVFERLGIAVGTRRHAAPGAVARTLREAVMAGGNDLEAPARSLCPAIGEVLAEIAATPGCRLARMSGSGATCFGLYDDDGAAGAAARAIAARRRGWWVAEAGLC